MQLVEATRGDDSDVMEACGGAAMVVVFASGDDLRSLETAGHGALPLAPSYSISGEDAYLVLPEDIGDEIVDILRDGDAELLSDAMTEGLLVVGRVRHDRGSGPELLARACMTPAAALGASMPYAASEPIAGDGDAVMRINRMPHLQCTTLSALIDDDGLDAILGTPVHIGRSWRVAPHLKSLGDVEPTHVWSRHLGPGRIGIELALFVEEEDLIALIRPLELLST